jgi:hypothetical protein
MSETNPFFLWIFRIAGLLVLGLLLVLAYFVVTGWWESRERRERRGEDVVKVEQKAPDGRTQRLALQFGNVEALPGTGRMLLPVESRDDDDSGKFVSSSSYEQSHIRNLIFVDAGYGKARWLYPDNDQVIVDHALMRECPGNEGAATAWSASDGGDAADAAAAATAPPGTPCDEDTRGATRAVFLAVRHSDSNRDSELDEKDAATFALVRPDGTGYTELTGPAMRVLDRRIRGDSIGLLVQTGSRLGYRRYAIADFTLQSDTAVADLRR